MSERAADETDRDEHADRPGSGLNQWRRARRQGFPDVMPAGDWIVGRFNQIAFAFNGAELRLAIYIGVPHGRKRGRRSRPRK